MSVPQNASSVPAIAPKIATTRLSVSICLTSRQRVAPSAPRMASSFARNAARPIAIGQIILTVDFVLAAGRERHPETIGHRCGFEFRIVAQRTDRAGEEIAARFLGRIRRFHQGQACGVEAVLVVAVIELHLVADRFDLQ